MHVIQDLLSLIKSQNDLLEPFVNLHPHIREVMSTCTTLAFAEKVVTVRSLQQIEYVLVYLHDHLNMGKWDEVDECKKQAFYSASYIKTLLVLKQKSSLKEAKNALIVRDALRIVDKGFLLGLPLKDNVKLLTDCASVLTQYVNLHDSTDLVRSATSDAPRTPKFKKTKVAHQFPVTARPIDVSTCPSISTFKEDYFSKQKPVVIQDCMTIWPAMTKWLDINYLLRVGGERTVPVELGSSYSSEDFSQKLMTLREFISKYYDADDGEEIGYLAQHDLLSQIPELLADIKVPDYCCLSRELHDGNDDDTTDEPEINAWLGPKGTVSSLHYDPKDNLLCQVYGEKHIIVFPPSDTQFLYVHDDMPMLKNTSQIDPTNPDVAAFPDFLKTTMFACTLRAGEMLYIPPKWWHHVTALQKSFSVNFWWK